MDTLGDNKCKFPVTAEYDCISADDGFYIRNTASLAVWLGYAEAELENKKWHDIIAAPMKEQAESVLRDRLSRGEKTEMLLPFVGKDGTQVWGLNCSMAENADGEIRIYNAVIPTPETGATWMALQEERNAYRQKLSQTESIIGSLQVSVSQDSLTRLLNAASTRNMAEEYLACQSKNCTVFVIDIDDFKQVNDNYGHIIGDEVMIGAAAAIKKLFRSGDIVGRIGGDEFLVLMKDVEDISIIRLRCAQIVAAFREVQTSKDESVRISCSVGAAMCPIHGKNYDKLYALADQAMYRAKNAGGNSYVIEGYPELG